MMLLYRLMNYVHGYYHLETMKLYIMNLIFNLFYQNQNHLMINQLKLMKMQRTIMIELLLLLKVNMVDHQTFFQLQMKLNHQENDYMLTIIKHFLSLCL